MDTKGRLVVLAALAATAIACGAEPPPRQETGPVGGLVPVADTKAEVHRYATEAADTAGAPLVTVSEKKVGCDSDRVEYSLDVYRIEGEYKIDVSAGQRKAAVEKIRALWKSKGLKLDDEPAPNDVEASAPNQVSLGLQPAREGVTLPLYVNSGCHTDPVRSSP
jgi:hypothetical protein